MCDLARLMDQESFRQRAAQQRIAPEDALGTSTLENECPACYSAVIVTYNQDGIPQHALQNGLTSETDATGELIRACD